MVVIEFYRQREDGVNLYRSYSSEGKYIERDGIPYEEAIDPEDTNRSYTEMNELIPVEETEEPVEEEPSDPELE